MNPNFNTGTDALRIALDSSPMNLRRVLIIVLATLIAALDGYDVQSMALVAPVVSKAWTIDKATLGLILGSSLFGMAGGALGLSPLGDVIGRRWMVLIALALMTGGTLLSAVSGVVWELTLSRVITGIGIGVMVALTTSVAAEFSNKRCRSFAVAATTTGFALGGVIGGLAASSILKAYDWHGVFTVGAIVGAVLLVVCAFALPESPAFLMTRRPKNALQRLNRVLLRIGQAPLAELPMQVQRPCASYRALFNDGMGSTTLRLAVVYLLIVTAAYYLISWMPQLVADAGFPPSVASLVTARAHLAGLAAGLIMGLIANRYGPHWMTGLGMICFGVSLAAMGHVPPVLTSLLLATSACVFFLSGTTAVFSASLAETFPPQMRVSGIGFVTGFGRLMSGIGPAAAGLLFASGWGRSQVSLIFACGAVLAGLLFLAPRLLGRGLRKAAERADVVPPQAGQAR